MLLSTEKDGSLRLRPYRAVAEQSRGLLRDLPGGSMVDGLLAERRAEAAREDAELRRAASRAGFVLLPEAR
jgi:hypothetical protein